ncbi:hypothetical protein Acsp06_42380 [Actinomycetospora sp. NBRC 106375]|uniref:ATP synthase subunit I n=1 Tax=Actinomycetospora sp. NBRC 106375 TaxID=3032207 RepID=UPI0024A166F3|nr:ATP synthase subunit I [Actinomycetospora sp. NBRC 106375]GLZ48053.1 hypothetical protein Acsp06_42380 [Actinomycetospora sp. NBRC 106375]
MTDTPEQTPEHAPVVTVPGSTRTAYRNSLIVAVALGVVALACGYLFGFAAAAAFGCLGLVLGAANNLLVQRAVLHQAASDMPSKAALVRGVGARLAVITGIAVVLALTFFPDGLGTFLGLAVFQCINTIAGSVPALKELRQ